MSLIYVTVAFEIVVYFEEIGKVGDLHPGCTTVDPKSFVYQFLTTLDERERGVPNEVIKERGERVTNVTRIIT